MQSNQFLFISDIRYRKILEQDYQEILKCIDTGANKAAATISGSIVEALLTDYLLDKGVDKVQKGKTGSTIKVENAGLGNLIEYCNNNNLVSSKSYHLLQAIRDFRNLIHPAKSIRVKTTASEKDARLYKSALDIIIEEIGAIRQKEFGATADQLLAFVITDENAVELFPHMVQSANSEEERRKFLTEEVPNKLENQHEILNNYFDQDGEPIFDNFEDANYVHYLKVLIKRVYLCFHICYEISSDESRKQTAYKLLKILKFGKPIEKQFGINLFEPTMLTFLDKEDAIFVTKYLVIYLKSIETDRLSQILPELSKLIDETYIVRILEAVLYHIRHKEAIHITGATTEFLTVIKSRFIDTYIRSLKMMRESITDSGYEEIQKYNDAVIEIFTGLYEEPPKYVPF